MYGLAVRVLRSASGGAGPRSNSPIVQRPPLARALYRQVAVGQEIPPDFYHAVAEILAYVYQLNGRMAG